MSIRPSNQEIRDAAHDALLQSKMEVVGKVKEGKDSSATFEVKSLSSGQVYEITVGKNVLASMAADPQAKKDWADGLAIQLTTMHEKGEQLSSFNAVDRSITVNGKAFFFTTGEQLRAHQEAYRAVIGNLPAAQAQVKAIETQMGAIEQQIEGEKGQIKQRSPLKAYFLSEDDKRMNNIHKRRIETLQGQLASLRTQKAEADRNLGRLNREADVMDVVHLLAGRTLIEGGITPLPDPNQTAVAGARKYAELPADAPKAPGAQGVVITAGTKTAPASLKHVDDLASEPLTRAPATKQTQRMVPHDGRSDIVLDLLALVEGGTYPSPTYLKDLKTKSLTDNEQLALKKGVSELQERLTKEREDLKKSSAPTGDIDRRLAEIHFLNSALKSIFPPWDFLKWR